MLPIYRYSKRTNSAMVPHFASKLTVEGALREFGVPFTILRPGCYIQNDGNLKGALTGPGVYPMPIGTAGICAVDIRDIAEVAAISLTQDGHDGQTYDLVGPTMITGPGNAATWGKLLGKEIRYTGHDFGQWEQQMRGRAPNWTAFDLRICSRAILIVVSLPRKPRLCYVHPEVL